MAEKGKAKRAYSPRAKAPPGPKFPEGVPIDPQTGLPLTDVILDREEVRRIGAYDAVSAQVTQEHRNRMAAKQRGERVIFNSDQHVALEEMLADHPTAQIYIRQISPKKDDNIPARPLAFIKDFDGLRKYIIDSHWNRKDAVYQWFVRAKGYPQIGTGEITFAEVEEMQHGGNGGNHGGYPPQGYPPPNHPGFSPPLYTPYAPPYPLPYPPYSPYPPQVAPAMPAPAPAPASAQQAAPTQQVPVGPQMPGQPLLTPEGALVGWIINGMTYYLAPQAGQAAAAPPPSPAPSPPPAPAPVAQPAAGSDFQMFLVTQLLEMSKNNASFMEQMRQMYEQRQQPQQVQAPYPYPFMPPQAPQYPGMVAAGYGYPPGLVVGAPQPVQTPQQPSQQQPTQPAEPSPAPLTPMQVMAQGLRDAKQQIALVQDFTETVRDFAGGGPVTPPPTSPTMPDDDMPLRTREVNGVTVGSIDGEMLSPGEQALLNAPKVIGILGNLADRFFDRLEKVKHESAEKEQRELERRRAEVELEERQNRARIEAQKQKVEFEAAKLQIRAAHAHLDTQGVSVQEPPPPPAPAPVPEESVKEPENVPVAAPPNGAMI